ncbi:MAG: DEAD/DEAH box helicase [Candidatus Omnitrophica bacterium]|nr:DEAD/DEAH box helicase [Candidatus Omnitrophota bacterium]
MSSLEKVLKHFRPGGKWSSQVAHWQTIPPKAARFGEWPSNLHPEIVAAIKERGIDQLYSHQTEAVRISLEGKNVVVVTPTASGKTYCYNLPVLQRICDNPEARALYLFPTKALSQDQMLELHDLSEKLDRDIKVFTFDGDTPPNARKAIRNSGHIVVTNPDMLHTGILPHHTNWIKLFENLETIVIDEVHQYRGIFGSHLANVLRRLMRICKFYGVSPKFVCCSATIANPKQLVEELVGEEFELIGESGAPTGERHVVFYNPPVINPELGIRASSVKAASRIAARLISEDVQTITFARSRKRVEVITTYLRRIMGRLRRDPSVIQGYRGGYLPLERREIERDVKSGKIRGVVSTNALELGIDIGQLEAAVLAGYPGTVASTWQQGGRAGRRATESLVVVVMNSSALDQYLAHHPEFFFGASPEHGIVNPENLFILSAHLKCGAFEIPFDEGEKFGPLDITPILNYLSEERVLRHRGKRWYYSSDNYPAEEVSLRTADPCNFVILNRSKGNHVLGEVDYASAPEMIHEEAVYLHQTRVYLIETLDWENRRAYAREAELDYYTDAVTKRDIRVLECNLHEEVPLPTGEGALQPVVVSEAMVEKTAQEELEEGVLEPREEVLLAEGRDVDNVIFLNRRPEEATIAEIDSLASHQWGEVSVTTLVAKYKKIRFETHENVGFGEVHLPEQELQTEAYWISFEPWLDRALKMKGLSLGGGIRALASALASVAPLHVMCDPRDIRSVPMVKSPFVEKPTIFLYDYYPGGVGIARKVFEMKKTVWTSVYNLVRGCECERGCPACVGPPVDVGATGKQSALAILLQLKD